ncbi:MAG TPA: HD domain-containing phosphohydrolase [Thermoanaerobaculia bacterium]|nr:HD domain-containing phosphohydrolase [Thermoanaerobaculia bacterium]
MLVVDDEAYIRELLVRYLESEGYDCATAGSVDAALARLDQEPFTLLISDINMPGKSGMELLATVRVNHPHLAVIMVTAVDDRRTAIDALKLGAFGYVIKPFDMNEISINVANAVERRRLALLSQAHQERLEEEVRRRTVQIRSREEEIALRLVAAAEYRDTDTGAHVRRIGLFSAALGRQLRWPAQMLDDLHVAAMMHDIGKIGVPDSILLKPGSLTAEEFEIIKQHTVIGASILEESHIPMLEMAAEIALSHHERWDGGGYPQGLSGEAIPQTARIVAVVDVYDALIHDRVYRPAWPEENVVALLRSDRGLHFDPQLVDAFLEILPEIHDIRRKVRQGA